VDAESKGRLLGLLRAFPKDEPTKKKFVGEMVAWSSRFGDYPAGDPEIHHVAGGLYAEGTPITPPTLPHIPRPESKPTILTKSPHRPRTLRSRTPPPPRHPRLRLNPLLPPLLLVHLRRTPHRTPLPRPRHPPLPAHRKPARRKQTLPPLHLVPATRAEPAHAARFNKVLRLHRIPLATTVELSGAVAAECRARGSESVEAAQEPLCGGSEGCELGGGVGSGGRDVFWD